MLRWMLQLLVVAPALVGIRLRELGQLGGTLGSLRCRMAKRVSAATNP